MQIIPCFHPPTPLLGAGTPQIYNYIKDLGGQLQLGQCRDYSSWVIRVWSCGKVVVRTRAYTNISYTSLSRLSPLHQTRGAKVSFFLHIYSLFPVSFLFYILAFPFACWHSLFISWLPWHYFVCNIFSSLQPMERKGSSHYWQPEKKSVLTEEDSSLLNLDPLLQVLIPLHQW